MRDAGKREIFIWHALPAAAAVLWGLFCVTDQLWYDEAYSAALVMQPWRRLVYITAVDDHSPFYYALLKLFYHLCGGGTRFGSLKIFSLLFMMGYMLLGKYYVRKLFGRRISIWFMLCSLLMPIMSVQAGNVRMYPMALFFMTLTGLSAYDIYLEPGRRKWVVFCLASVCTVYCHTFAMIQTVWLYGIFGAVLLYRRQYQKLKGFFLCSAVVSVLFSPWLLVTLKQMWLRMHYDLGSAVNLAEISAFMDYCIEWFSAVETPIGAVVFLGMGVAVVLGYFAVDRMREEKNYVPALGMAALGLTVLTGGIVSAFINNCFLGRYVFPGFGFLMLFYAFGMERIKSLCFRSAILTAMLCCFILQYRSEMRLEYDGGLERYEQFVEEQVRADDVVVGPYIHALFLSVYHPELQYKLEGYVEDEIPFPNLEACYDTNQLLKGDGNVWYICFQGWTPGGSEADYEEVMSFHYMYYDFVIYKLCGG